MKPFTLLYDPAAAAPPIRAALELIAEDFPIKPATEESQRLV